MAIMWTSGQPIYQNKYIIDEMLGEGGFGITYRGREKRSGKIVAIKTLNRKQQNKSDFTQEQVKFVNEALRLAKCSHPHIVKVYEVFEENGLWGMVMEYIDGISLADYLEDKGILAENDALRMIREIGEALTVVHQQGFLHRDVKPLNIMLRRNNLDKNLEAVLIDFGLAREFVQNQLKTHTNNLTEYFAPIEQYQQKAERGAYTDVYSLAATLYVMLTLQFPCPARFRKEANVSLIPPKNHNSKISDRVNDGIIQGMALEPKDRPQTVQDWLNLILDAPSPVVATPVPKLSTFQFEVITVNNKGEIINKQRRQAEYLSENLGNGVNLDMVSIPGGTFMMGSPNLEAKRYDREGPQHQVTVKPFFMGKFTVTQAQWRAVAALPKIKIDLNTDPSDFKGTNRPVEEVNWYEAVEFCARLSQKTGKKYRLPSEAEWEYACRAGTTTPFYFGKTITTDLVNYDGNYTYAAAPKGIYRKETMDVGSFPPNAFGLYDMHGNVWEWCADNWYVNYNTAPIDGSVWQGGDDKYRLLRGGSWVIPAVTCRAASRNRSSPVDRSGSFGFRVVCAGGWTP